jgi:hypothetical protein
MGGKIKPAPDAYELEWRLHFDSQSPSGVIVVVSGFVNIRDDAVHGTSDDSFEDYEVRLIVGPWLKGVRMVVPHVTVGFFENTNADEDDEQGWMLGSSAGSGSGFLKWDAVGGPPGPHQDEERIRLIFDTRLKGENSYIRGFTYYLTAIARELGEQGMNSPPARGSI